MIATSGSPGNKIRLTGLLALFSFVLCDSLNSRRQLCRRCDGDFFEVGARVRDGV